MSNLEDKTNLDRRGAYQITGLFNSLLELRSILEFRDPHLLHDFWQVIELLELNSTGKGYQYLDFYQHPNIIVYKVSASEEAHETCFAKLEKIDPRLIGVGYLAERCTTNGDMGWRFYCQLEEGAHTRQYRSLFAMRSWVQGLSGVRQVSPGEYAIREFVTVDLFSLREFLSNAPASPPQLTAPIEFRPGGLLSTKSYPFLDQHEKAMLVNNCASAIARCPLSHEAANVDRLSLAIWRGVHHDAQEGGDQHE